MFTEALAFVCLGPAGGGRPKAHKRPGLKPWVMIGRKWSALCAVLESGLKSAAWGTRAPRLGSNEGGCEHNKKENSYQSNGGNGKGALSCPGEKSNTTPAITAEDLSIRGVYAECG